MEWTPAAVIGHNAKVRREALGMTAKRLGEEMGAIFGKGGKPWPPQAVYMMEAGDRAMVAAEVVGLGKVLGLRVADLYAPPVDVEEVHAGTLTVPASDLAAPAADDPDLATLAETFQAVDVVRRRLYAEASVLHQITDDARAAIRGEERRQPGSTGDPLARLTAADYMVLVTREATEQVYEEVRAQRDREPLADLEDVLQDGTDQDGGR